MIEAYPLTWPMGYDRTEPSKRKASQFRMTAGKAIDTLRREVTKITDYKKHDLIISTNIPVKKDGYFYANEADRKIDEPGVAIYFQYKGKQVALCCDQYLTPKENILALGKTINALRAIDRYGVSDFLNRTFTGFKELPQTVEISCWQILGIEPTRDADIIKDVYRKKAMELHPDKGGDSHEFARLSAAYDLAMKKAKSFQPL